MKGCFRLSAAGLLLACAGLAGAQEIDCGQRFMNDSEDAICGSQELMRLDLEMAQAFRRVELHAPQERSQHRKLRRALRSCKGDIQCLTRSYEVRTEELRAAIHTLPRLSDEQAESLGEAYDNEAAIRELYAAQLAEKAQRDAEEAAAAESLRLANQKALEQERERQAQVALEEQARLAAEQESTAAAAAASTPRPSNDGTLTSIIILAVILAFIVYCIVLAWEWFKDAVARCPRCTTWFAGIVIDQDQEAYTDYKTVDRVETHRDKNLNVKGSRRYKEQIRERVVITTKHMKCQNCAHEWPTTSTRRSS